MRRLNVKLLVALVGAAAVLLLGIYFLHDYQVAKNAEVFKQLAYESHEKEDLDQAVRNLQRYLKYRDDDVAARCDYAMWYADSIEASPSPTPDQVRYVPLVLEQALREATIAGENRDDIRRRLGRFYLESGRVPDALTHFTALLERHKEDGELYLLIGVCQERDKNYTDAKTSYETAKEKAPDLLEAYAQLASLLAGPLEDPKAGDEIMVKLVDNNPDDHRAYLMRYSYRMKHVFGTRDDAKQDLRKALELAPEEADVIVKMAELMTLDREFDEARQLLARGIELHPTEANMYIGLAYVELEEGRLAETPRYDEALQHLLDGLKQAPENTLLLMQIAELHIRREHYDSANDTIAKLVQLGVSQPEVDFLRARVMLGEQKWAEAERVLLSVRQRSSRDPNVLFNIDVLLAQCYEKLGMADRQLDALKRALENNPYSVDARRQLVRVLQLLGRSGEAQAQIDRLPSGSGQVVFERLRSLISEQVARPLDQRDFSEIDRLLERLAAEAPDGPELALIKVRVLIDKGKHDEALQLAREQRDRFPDSVQLWVTIADIEGLKDVPQAISTLKVALERFPKSVLLQQALVLKAVRLPHEEAIPSLKAIAGTIDAYPLEEQRALAQTLAEALYAARDFAAAKDVLHTVAARLPSDVTLRLMAFNLARDSRDEEGMTEAVANLEQVVGKDHSYWQYCEAARLATLVGLKKADPQALDQARRLVDKVVQTRPTWPAIIRLSAEIDDLSGQRDEAIRKYQSAADLGEASVSMIRRLVELLYLAERYPEAYKALAMLPPNIKFTDDFQKLETELTKRLGEVDEAAQMALRAVDPDSTEFKDHLWQGQILARSGYRAEAETAFRRAVQHGAKESLCWVALVNQLVQNGKRDEAEQQMTAMQSALDRDDLPMALGQCFEVLERPEEASQAYAAAVAAAPDEVAVLRGAAEFYVRNEQRPKARAVLEQLVALAPKKSDEKDQDSIRWGRRTLAALVATSNSYVDLRRAAQLLDANADSNGGLSLEDKLIKARLLAPRDDLRSRREAIALYEDVLSREPGRAADRFQLARLYERDQKWHKCRENMLQLISGDRDSVLYIPVFANMLIRHGDFDDAARMLEKLEQIDPNAQITLAVKALLYARRDRIDQAIEITRELVVRPLAPQQVGKLIEVAQQFERLAETEVAQKEFLGAAEELYEEYLRERPEDVFLMAVFQGKYGDIDRALTICEDHLSADNAPNVVGLAIGIVRTRRDEVSAEQIARVEKLILNAQQMVPDDVGVLTHLADLRGLQENYSESAQLLRKAVAHPKASPVQRAAANNNLAYLMAVHEKNGKDALPLVQQAINFFGPTSELLDTRGVVHIMLGDYASARNDLSEAVEDTPNSLKYFHLAWVYYNLGNEQDAKEALRLAVEEHQLKEKELSPLEREWLAKLREIKLSAAASP